MRIGEGLLAELEQESATTQRVLERIPEDKLAWKPHEKSMTLGVLALHVARIPGTIAKAVEGDTHSFDSYSGPAVPSTTQEILGSHNSGLAVARKYLGSLEDGRALEIWTTFYGGKEAFALPRVMAIRGMMLNHLYHHRGQLSVYLRLPNVPVPAIYGPSADEQPPGIDREQPANT